MKDHCNSNWLGGSNTRVLHPFSILSGAKLAGINWLDVRVTLTIWEYGGHYTMKKQRKKDIGGPVAGSPVGCI